MPYIYEPKGKAGEYGKLALNLYNGCSHGCKYCYVPSFTKKVPERFHKYPEVRFLDMNLLDKELQSHSGQSVFLCFTCDPYQPLDEEKQATRRALELFERHGVSPILLTKGGNRSLRDLDILRKIPGSLYGATLTFLNDDHSKYVEPLAALPQERMDVLKKAYSMGIATWASLEPVISVKQSLEIINRTADFIDEFKIGRWNHSPKSDQIDWKSFAEEATSLCQKLGKKYYIKKDLAAFLFPLTNKPVMTYI